MTRWYALLDDESIDELGEHENFSEAADMEPGNTVWLFTEKALTRLRDRINEALDQEKQS